MRLNETFQGSVPTPMDCGDDAFGALEYDLNEPQRHGENEGEEDGSHAVLRSLVTNRPIAQPPRRLDESSPLGVLGSVANCNWVGVRV